MTPRDPASLADMRRALEYITDADDRDLWLRIGMALHHETGGSDEGYQLWGTWSEQSFKFDSKVQRQTWKGFGKSRAAPVTAASIFEIAKKYGWTGAPEIADDEFDDLPPKAVEPKPIYNKNKTLAATLSSAAFVLDKVTRLERWEIRHNEFSGQDEWNGEVVTDSHLDFVQMYIEQGGMPNVGKERTFQAIRTQARRRTYHPVRDYLEPLRHDGVARLDTWLTRYLQVEDSPYVRAVGRAFLIAMVARVMRPGCKHDHVLVMRGAQGLRKSTACAIIGGDWFGDSQPPIVPGNKDADQYPAGRWLIELAEGAPTRKADQEHLKAFVTRGVDELRLPYGRLVSQFPRQSVFVITTNEDEMLRDATGGRRFWPVTVEQQIYTDALARDRDQLFAEAVAAFRAGEQWHLTAEVEALAAEVQEDAREEDPWESIIRDYLDGEDLDGAKRESVEMKELLWKALEIPLAQQMPHHGRRAGAILRKMGFIKGQTGRNRAKVWVRG